MKIGVSEFKAKCTQILRQVTTSRESVEVTNRGVVIAVVVPPAAQEESGGGEFLGSLRGTASYVGDILSPVAEGEWDAAR
jgi:prevent-host-death family protein